MYVPYDGVVANMNSQFVWDSPNPVFVILTLAPTSVTESTYSVNIIKS